MEKIKIKNLNLTYPETEKPALKDISLEILRGEFVTVFGKSGCGKTTLLKSLKPEIAPVGEKCGEILLDGEELSIANSGKIGFVLQNPENSIVCDKVWHELAFGAESMGMKQEEIHAKVAELTSFFGISHLFYNDTATLSGGQKQLLSLASVMVTQPEVLVLDEPTAQLDPTHADEFLRTLKKINEEMGITVILSEHRLEEAVSLSDKVIALDGGSVRFCGNPADMGKVMAESDMADLLPVPVKVHSTVQNGYKCPVTVKEGKVWLEQMCEKRKPHEIQRKKRICAEEKIICAKNVYFRYEKDGEDILKDFSIEVKKGEIYAILGANGVGKTTALKVLSRLKKPYEGKVENYGIKVMTVPQNPIFVFTEQTLLEDILLMAENRETALHTMEMCNVAELAHRNPFDLSGGEIQRAAIAKVLAANPDVLLLDEPTKGMDGCFKKQFKKLLGTLSKNGITVVMVSHDVEFCAEAAHKCGLFFDGAITAEGNPADFFADMNFYTTAAARMSRGIIPGAVTADDIIKALGAESQKEEEVIPRCPVEIEPREKAETSVKKSVGKVLGFVFLSVFLLSAIGQYIFKDMAKWMEYSMIISFAAAFAAFGGGKFFHVGIASAEKPVRQKKKSIFVYLTSLVIIPVTLLAGVYIFEDKQFYLISICIILETLVTFFAAFELRRPGAKELVVVALLCAFAVAGRNAFFMVQFFKPTVAIILLSGFVLGGETGFLVGSISFFVSNIFFSQGPWTPWQMFAAGMVGFLAGMFGKINVLRKNKLALCVFGFIATVIIYGGVVDIGSALMVNRYPTKGMILSSLALGLPYNLIHGVSTVFFLWVLSEFFVEKLWRIKIKNGL